MAIRAKLTTQEELAARKGTQGGGGTKRVISEEEKAKRKERVTQAKEALARSVGAKGDHVAAGRAALKTYLQNLNDPKQPDDERFAALLEAPFKAPPKKNQNDRRF
jgi:hypothetical protein